MHYSEKLKDPRWQKKRLEILERDAWACQVCGGKEKTLHVHHNKYSNNPWDAKNDDLVTLCEDCHQETHEEQANCKSTIKEINELISCYCYEELAGLHGMLVDHSCLSQAEHPIVAMGILTSAAHNTFKLCMHMPKGRE